MERKKELREIYKKKKFKMGVFQLRNTGNQKIFIGSSTDLDAIWNRLQTELKFGTYPNVDLQKDWNALGAEGFVFEILCELKPDEAEKNPNYRKELRQLEEMFIDELHPFGEKGYNREK